MPRTFALKAVLAVRQQKEDAEERTLASLAAQENQIRTAIARIDQELARLQVARANEVQTLQLGAQHQASFAKWKSLREAQAGLRAQLEALESRRLEQQARYLTARSDREMLTELQQKQRAAWDAETKLREQKRIDDLFNARRRRN